MATFAKVAIESPLPQLDRLFDYLVPDELTSQIAVGQRVFVSFGSAKRPIEAFVVEVSDSISYEGKVAHVDSIVSPNIVLPKNLYQIIRAVSDRQAVSFGDVAKSAIPARAVRVDKAWLPTNNPVQSEKPEATLAATLCEPRIRSVEYGGINLTTNVWVHNAIEIALDAIAAAGSCIICVPDFRDVEATVAAFEKLGLGSLINRHGSENSKTQRYESHLNATQLLPQIVIGTRSALYAPLQNLRAIVIWDDEDTSHYDQSSPYVSSREVALIRQQIDECSLHFLSHSRSVAVQRLVSIGYLLEDTHSWPKPTVAFSERDVRVDSLAFTTLRTGLSSGPVLVQVSNLGVAKSAYCRGCQTRALCLHCGGPLWIDERSAVRCRWCNGFNTAFKCAGCNGTTLRMGRAGSTRTAAELGKAFPGFSVVEATGDQVVTRITDKPQIVISTPGAEPQAPEGYRAVVILDCDVALARDTLHAREDALRSWANAIALGSSECRAALVGLGADLGTYLSTWALSEFARSELDQRSKLGFPPANRMLSATGEKTKVEELIQGLIALEGVSKLGLAPSEESGQWRALVRFTYASGKVVADLVRAFQLKNSSSSRVSRDSGRSRRAVSIKIDDPRVL